MKSYPSFTANRLGLRLSVVVLFVLISVTAGAQRIFYTEPERDDNRRTNFEIIGKVGGNILIFKNNRSDNDISVYDQEMKLIERVNLDYVDDRWIDVDFVPYADFCWMIYQYQRKNTVYCMGVKIDGSGKAISDARELDTTRIGITANNKIYSTIFSDDKSKIMVFKINTYNQRNFVDTTMLFNNEVSQEARHVMNMSMVERNDFFTDFLLDNERDMIFGQFTGKNSSDYISDVKRIRKAAA